MSKNRKKCYQCCATTKSVTDVMLFINYTLTGVDPNDAKYIQINAVITKNDPSVSYYKVAFRVWDKKGDAEIKGGYKFYIQAE